MNTDVFPRGGTTAAPHAAKVQGTHGRDSADGNRDAAVWRVRLRWPVAIGFALVPVVFTAAASAVAQIAHASEPASALIIAVGAAVSALVGLFTMRMSAPAVRAYGFRSPRRASSVWWFAPLPLTLVLVVATAGIRVGWQALLAYLVLSVAVAFNEEIWFRGIVLAVLRAGGVRVAILGSSILFGVLHLANLAGGEGPAQAGLQLVFAVVFGVVAAELIVITGSLWPAIAWHALWDFTNYLGGDSTTELALAGVGVSCVVMIVFAVVLWQRAARN